MLIFLVILSFRLHWRHLKGSVAKRKPLINFWSRGGGGGGGGGQQRWDGHVWHWTVQGNWRHVIFSDEFRVTLFMGYGRMIVWRQENIQYVPKCIQPIHIQNRERLVFLGCIGYGHRGHLAKVNGNLDQLQHTMILQERIISSPQAIFWRRNPIF